MNFLRRIGAVAAKEVRQLRRDRLSFGMIVALPIMQLLLFGYAINMDPRNLSAGLVDLAQTAASRQYVMDLSQSQVIQINHQVASAEDLEALMRGGHISVGILLIFRFITAPLTRIANGLRVDQPAGLEGLVVATGHYRNGVLLSAVTARMVADGVLGKGWAEPAFAPDRFASVD